VRVDGRRDRNKLPVVSQYLVFGTKLGPPLLCLHLFTLARFPANHSVQISEKARQLDVICIIAVDYLISSHENQPKERLRFYRNVGTTDLH
jgi:hypothetical protein